MNPPPQIKILIVDDEEDFMGANTEDPNRFSGGIVAYVMVLLSVFMVSTGYHEARWMRRWEKKTGRKIYVKEIIEWKRLQERKQAEQTKLRSLQN